MDVATLNKTAPSQVEPTLERDEACILSSLSQLQQMHIQLRLLRDTIPSLMRAIHVEHSSPEELYTDISRTVVKAVTNIKNFTAVLQEPYSQAVLLKAKESHAESNEGIMTWLVTQHPKWLDKLEDDTKDLRLDSGAGQDGDKGEELEQEDVPTIISKFQEEHTNFEITVDQERQTLQVSLPSPARISFQVDLQSKPNRAAMYATSCKDTSKLHIGILQAVAKRPHPDNLCLLLEMLISYSDVKSRPCQKCSQLLDFNAQFPVVRARDMAAKSERGELPPWGALHPGCHQTA